MENWKRSDTHFIRAYRRAREQAFRVAVGRLARAANEAATTLIRGMKGKNVSNLQRLFARDILAFARDRIATDVTASLAEIDEQLQVILEAEQ